MGLAVAEVDTHGIGEQEVSDEDLVAIARSWVLRALTSVSNGGDRGHYTKLLNDLRDPRLNHASSASALSIRFMALSQTVSYMDEQAHQALLMYLLGMSIWTYSDEVVESLLAFVVNLSTANGIFVPQCLDMLVRNFLPPSCGLPAFLDSFSRTGLMMGFLSMDKLRMQSSEHLAKKDRVLGCLHSALLQILELVPTAAFRLQPIVVQRMPHRTSEKQWVILYFESMLRLETMLLGRNHGGQILLAIVDRLIEIDVEIRWEDILREDDSNKVFMFHMNLDDDSALGVKDSDEGYSLADSTGPGCEAKQQHGLVATRQIQNGELPTLDEMADKMDLMMDMTFEHLQLCVKQGHGNELFETLISSFQTTILDTYKSKFTQFLVFYLCSLAPATCGSSFASLLCDIFISKTRPPNTRMSAAAYLASYLARASYLPQSVVLESVRRLLEWCVSYAQLAEDRRNPCMSTADPVLHGVFYSACQAVMYVLCFRLKDLTEDSKLKRILRNLPLQELVEHHLKPLMVCLPSVVEEFVKQASIAQLVDCRAWADSKEICGAHKLAGSFGGEGRLDMFFPFDPYLLKQSDRFIRPHFIHWLMVELPEVQEEVSEEDDDFVNATFSEPSSSWEDDSLQDMAQIPASFMGSLDHAYSYEEDMGRTSHRDRRRKSENHCRGGFESGSFNSDDGGFVGSFLDHMSYTPPRELPRIPAKLPAVLHPSLFI